MPPIQPIPFTAASAEEAVAQIRAKLGPEAVVLNVRRLPLNGLARLWQQPMIEVLAYRPEEIAPESAPESTPITEALAEFRQQLHEIKLQVENQQFENQQTENRPAKFETRTEIEIPAALPEFSNFAPAVDGAGLDSGRWRVGAVLHRSGLLALHTQQVIDRLRVQYGDNPPASLSEEISLAQTVLGSLWRKAAPESARSLHVLVGPAGTGKTTCLCKWLTQAVLMEGRKARVWRLDGATANMAESLSVYCEILGTPSERAWQRESANITEDIGFIDLPGVDWRKPLALKELAAQLKQFGSPRIHLVLNGAYDISILLAQIRAFAALPIEDLIITHLDEETRWGKFWNLALGTNYSVRHFSTGQNIPGDFREASAEMVFARQFPRK
jgi:flagellar biosynthesis protein FlhF